MKDIKNTMLRYAARGAGIACVVTIAVFALTIKPETFVQVKDIKWQFIPLLFLMIFLSWLCNALRLRSLLSALGKRVSVRQAFAITISSEFGAAASPSAIGAGVIMYTLLRRKGMTVSKIASYFTADFFLDMLFFATIFPFALIIIMKDFPLPSISINKQSIFIFILATIIIAAFFAAFLRSGEKKAIKILKTTPINKKYRLASRWRLLKFRFIKKASSSWKLTVFLFKRRKKAFVINFFLGSIQWISRYGVLPVIILSFSAVQNPFPLLLVQGIIFGISLFLVIPGGAGGVEVMTSFVLQYFVPIPLIAVVLVIWRFFTYYLYLLVGGLVFWRTFDRVESVYNGQRVQ